MYFFLLMITACPITSNTTCFASILSRLQLQNNMLTSYLFLFICLSTYSLIGMYIYPSYYPFLPLISHRYRPVKSMELTNWTKIFRQLLTSFSRVIGQSPPAFFIFFFLSFQSSVFLVSCIEILNGLWSGPAFLHTDTLDHLLLQICGSMISISRVPLPQM